MRYYFIMLITFVLLACKTRESPNKQAINQEMDTLNMGLLYSLHYTDSKELDSCLMSLWRNYISYEQCEAYAVFDSLLRKHLADTITYYNTLDSLQKQQDVFISQAPDCSFKIYSYDYGTRSQGFYRQYIQYKDDLGNITYKPFYLFGLEGEETRNLSNPVIFKFYPFKYKSKYYYLLFLHKRYSNAEAASYIAIATFKNGEPEYHTQFFPKEYQDEFCIGIDDTPWLSSELNYDSITHTISYKYNEYGNWRDTLATVTQVSWKLQHIKNQK